MAGFIKYLTSERTAIRLQCLFFTLTFVGSLAAQRELEEHVTFNGIFNSTLQLSPDCVYFYKNLTEEKDLSIFHTLTEKDFRISEKQDYLEKIFKKEVEWFVFKISNNSKEDTLHLYLEYGRIDYLRIFQETEKKTNYFTAGQFVSIDRRLYPDRFIVPLTILPESEDIFYLNPVTKCSHPEDFHFTLLGENIVFQKLQNSWWPKMKFGAIMGFFYGALTFIGIFACFQYFTGWDRVYLYYFLYVFSMIIFFMMHRVSHTPSIFSNHIEIIAGHNDTVIYLSLALYCLFLKEFLTLKDYPILNWIVNGSTVLFLICSIIHFVTITYDYKIMTFKHFFIPLKHFLRGFGLLVSVYALYKMRGNRLFIFIIVGSIILIVCNVVSSQLGVVYRNVLLGNTQYPKFVINLAFMDLKFTQIGILLEFLCFSIGLSYRAKNQILEEERKLSDTNKKLAESKLENINKEKEKAIFQQRILETELKALKAQMNPHFIANALNSIKCLIQEKKQEEATEYLAIFSELVRTILNFSEDKFVSLSRELSFCELFIKIESLRFYKNFSYQIVVEKGIDTSYIKIPPLILQPFIENTIWHGFNNTKNDRPLKIKISIMEQKEYIYCIIEDNGIGRKAARAITRKNTIQKKSYGILLTRERLKNTNQRYGTDFNLNIIDIENQKEKVTGTRVEINFTK